MTATQSLRIYETLNRHFKNSEDAKLVVEQIEQIVEEKIEAKKSVLLVKDDKIDIIERIHKAKIETIIWIVGIGVLQFIFIILSKKIL